MMSFSDSLCLFDEDIYFQSREALVVNQRDLRLNSTESNSVAYIFSPELAKAVAIQDQSFLKNESIDYASTFESLNQSTISNYSKFLNDEESDLQLLKLRMSNLQVSGRGNSKIDPSSSGHFHSKSAMEVPLVSSSSLQNDLQSIARALQLHSNDQIKTEAIAISREIHRIINQSPVSEIVQSKLCRLLHYYTSLQNALGLLDRLDKKNELKTSDSNMTEKKASGWILSDQSFTERNERSVFSREDEPLALVSLSTDFQNSNKEWNYERELDKLFREVALLSGASVKEVDTRLKEAEDALVESLQRIQTSSAKEGNSSQRRSVQSKRHGSTAKNMEELEHRRIYLHKLLAIHELMTSHGAMQRKPTVKQRSASRFHSVPTRIPLPVSRSRNTPESALTPGHQKVTRVISHVESDQAQNPSIIARNISPSKFGRTMLRHISPGRMSMESLAPSPNIAKFTPTHTYHPVTSLFSSSKQSLPNRTPSPASISIRADSLSPSMSTHKRNRAVSPSLTSTPLSASNHLSESKRSTSPLLFTAPAPPKSYQSPFLSSHGTALSPSLLPNPPTSSVKLSDFNSQRFSVSLDHPVSSSTPILPENIYPSSSLLPTNRRIFDDSGEEVAIAKKTLAETVSDRKYQSPLRHELKEMNHGSNEGILEGRKRSVSPSALASPSRRIANDSRSTSILAASHVGSKDLHVSFVEELNDSSILTDAQGGASQGLTTSMISASALQSASLSMIQPPTSTSLSLTSSSEMINPLSTSSLASSANVSTPTRSATPATTPKTLKSVRSFTEKDALFLNELLQTLHLNKFSTRSDLDQALHDTQHAFQDALKAGNSADAQHLKAQLEKLRAAYRLVALRG